ncbi:MAG: hypothetical protein IPN78_06840, partial [Candidatus Accumulibacter sp.]|nr:hypothetical protein [Candidatus Accumulibacter propinquus]
RAGVHLLHVPQPGRLLSQYYFPEESAEIRRLLLQKSSSEEAAALQVLGISFEELESGIA